MSILLDNRTPFFLEHLDNRTESMVILVAWWLWEHHHNCVFDGASRMPDIEEAKLWCLTCERIEYLMALILHLVVQLFVNGELFFVFSCLFSFYFLLVFVSILV